MNVLVDLVFLHPSWLWIVVGSLVGCQLDASLQTQINSMEGVYYIWGVGRLWTTLSPVPAMPCSPNRQDLLAAWHRELGKASWMEMPDGCFALVSSFYPEASIASLQSVVQQLPSLTTVAPLVMRELILPKCCKEIQGWGWAWVNCLNTTFV